MSLSGNISRPTLLAAWRSPTRPISRPRSVHPCVSCRTTRKKSDLSTKNHRSNMLREGELTYGLINMLVDLALLFPLVRYSSLHWRRERVWRCLGSQQITDEAVALTSDKIHP